MSTVTSSTSTSAFGELAPFVRKDTSEMLTKLLADNHAKHHCFFNTRGMHNHSAHQLIADLTLSGTPEQLDTHYRYQIQHYLGDFTLNDRVKYDPYVSTSTIGGKGQSVEKIDESNWTEHLGNARYYWSYLHFFDSLLKQCPFDEVLHKYVFSKAANIQERQMIVRFYGGVLHSLIHFGYALELNNPALAAEGLAMATCTTASHGWLFDYHWLTSAPSDTAQKSGLLELVKQLQADPRLSVERLKLKEQESSLPDDPFEKPGSEAYGVIQSYVDRWSAIQSTTQVNEEQAMGELALFSALLLGAVPTQPSGAYKHDFFLMHLNNAHLFTPLYLSLFSSPSRPSTPYLSVVFLRALLAQFLYYYIARGRPSFSSQSYHTEHVHSQTFDWQEMFAQARENVDEHLPKAVRALYVYHTRYLHLEPHLFHSGLLEPQSALPGVNNNDKQSVWKLTAQQLVRMHMGQLQPTKYNTSTANEKGESIGAHQEFWSFDPFF